MKLGLGTFCTMVRFLGFLTIFPLLSLFSFIYLFCVLPTNGKKVALHSQALNVSFISIFNFFPNCFSCSCWLFPPFLHFLRSVRFFWLMERIDAWVRVTVFAFHPHPGTRTYHSAPEDGPRWPLRLVQITEPIMERLGKIKQQHS